MKIHSDHSAYFITFSSFSLNIVMIFSTNLVNFLSTFLAIFLMVNKVDKFLPNFVKFSPNFVKFLGITKFGEQSCVNNFPSQIQRNIVQRCARGEGESRLGR